MQTCTFSDDIDAVSANNPKLRRFDNLRLKGTRHRWNVRLFSFKQKPRGLFRPISNVIDNSRVEKSLRDAMRETYPDLYPKRAAQPVQPVQQPPAQQTESTPAANHHSDAPMIIDLLDEEKEEPIPSTSAEEQEKEKPKTKEKKTKSEDHAEKTEKLKPRKRRKSSRAEESKEARAVCERRSSAAIEEYAEHELAKLKDVLPMVREEFREHLEALSKAVQAGEEPSDHVQALLGAIFESVSFCGERLSVHTCRCLRRTFWTTSNRSS